MKERISDYENKKTEERTKIRLFSPLTAIRYPRYDWEDLNGEGEELLPAELCSYQKEIRDQIAKERLPEEGDLGLAEYLNDEGLKEKIYSMNPTVEVWRGELWGVLEVECRGELSPNTGKVRKAMVGEKDLNSGRSKLRMGKCASVFGILEVIFLLRQKSN